MCIINLSRRFIFVHVPKAAGTSVTESLSQYTRFCDIEVGGTQYGEKLGRIYGRRFGISKHSTALEIRKVIGHDEWQSFFSFCFVRHPFDRALSIYKFLKYVHHDWKGHEVMSNFNSFKAFVHSDFFAGDGPDGIFRPQWVWVGSSSDTRPVVDYVGRVEKIDEEMQTIEARITQSGDHRSVKAIVQRNVSRDKGQVGDGWNDGDVLSAIYSKYKIDFERFGYEKGQMPNLHDIQPNRKQIDRGARLWSSVGTVEKRDGEQFVRVEDTEVGIVVYGPYEELGEGRYSVKFRIEPDTNAARNLVCCRIDITGDCGALKLAERKLSVGELRDSGNEIDALFDLPKASVVEYRVFAIGTAGFSVAYDRKAIATLAPPSAEIDQTILA